MDRVESNNLAIEDSYAKAESVFSKYAPSQVAVGISGGADSDIVLDICQRFDLDRKFHYCFFDTGMEMNATRRHLDFLEDRYGVKIERVRAYKSVPQSVREYGVPFTSKYASEQIRSLQKHNFPFVDGSLEELHEKYPNVPLSVLKWWTNWYANPKRGHSMWNINRNKYLKEFLIENPPTFKIAPKCCTYAKKRTAGKYYKDNKILLCVTGVRKSEGGYELLVTSASPIAARMPLPCIALYFGMATQARKNTTNCITSSIPMHTQSMDLFALDVLDAHSM